MNHTYRLVWNDGAQRRVPVAEVTPSRGKSRGGKVLARCVVLVAAVLCTTHGTRTLAAPTGGTVIAGRGSISQTGNTTTVQQQTQNLSLNWMSFSIAPSETVQFVQPSSTAVALNRVIGNDPSQIYGHLQANGQVFLINTNGVLFGTTAQVNVGGLVASTLNLTDADFLNGQYKFQSVTAGSTSPATPASVINEGVINASAGSSIALLGGQVSNQGVITAQLGTVALAAGSAVTLQFNGNRLLSVQVDQGAAGALAENRQLIQADGGKVIMTAAARDALLNTVVNNTGVIEARTIQNQGGEISLLGAEDGGTVSVGGTLDASAPTGGNGGNIETSGAHVQVTGTAVVTTKAAQGQSGTWLIDPSDFTVAASGGDITGAALSANLNNGNVTILSSQGTANTNGNGDININDAVSWTANNILTLNAVRDININSNITASGNTAGLILSYGSGRDYHLNNGAQVTLSGTNPSLTIGGQPFIVINSVGVDGDTSTTTLQGMQNNLSGYYALGTNIDASVTSGWTSYGGFLPIGSNSHTFDGELDGLGHTISKLTVSPSTGYAGLFGYVDGLGVIRDVNLFNGSVLVTGANDYVGGLAGYNIGNISNSTAIMAVTGESYVGGLVGYNSGIITNSWASGTVTASNASSTATATGGLAGYNIGIITNSHASATVIGNNEAGGLVGYNAGKISGSFAQGSASAANLYAGGLVGYNVGLIQQDAAAGSATTPRDGGGLVGYNAGTIQESNATGAVNVSGLYAGGLAGESTLTIEQSSASGSVTAGTAVGGLVGSNSGSITSSYASGTVTATGTTVGGLVGVNQPGGSITNDHATGSVTGQSVAAGGLAGKNIGTIDQSYATGSVEASGLVGGLVGQNLGALSGSFATGNVTATANPFGMVGGLVGLNTGTISTSYYLNPTGQVNGGSQNYVGGLVGYSDGSVDQSYATTNVVGVSSVGGLIGYADNTYGGTVTQSYASGTVSGSGGSIGGLIGTSSQDITNSYTGASVSGSGGNIGGFIGTVSGGTITNSYWIASGSTTDASAAVQLTAAQAEQSASYVNWDFSTIWRIYDGHTAPLLKTFLTPLTVTADNIQTTYNGQYYSGGLSNPTYSLSGVDTSGHLQGLATPYSAARNSGTYTPDLWSDQQGYDITLVGGGLTINPALLTITNSNVVKTYDGTTSAAGTAIATSGTRLFGTDSLSGGAFAFTAPNAGTNKTVTVGAVTVNDGNGGNNYSVTYVDNTASTINPATLTVSGATAADKTYDGGVAATVSGGSLGGVIGTDSVSLSQAGYFSDKDVGTNKSVQEIFSLAGTDAKDYILASNKAQTTANITPATLTITADNATKVANTANPSLTVTYSGFVSGESASSLTTGPIVSTTASANSAAGTYPITASDAADQNYTITYVPGALTVTTDPTTVITSSAGYAGAVSSLTQLSALTQLDPTIGDFGNLKSESDDSELYDGMLDIDTPKRMTEALPILALIILDKGIRLPDGVQ